MKVENVSRFATDLLDLLVDEGPLTSAEACEAMGWPRGRFDGAVKFARTELCPELGVTIPAPTPAEGWRYQVTTEWEPVEAGAAHALGHVESRLLSILRDVRIVAPHMKKGTTEWRRARFLEKHLTHITLTLEEINNGQG